MPYNRGYNNSRYKRRRYYKKKKYGYFGQAGADATKALRMAGKALSLINVEHKSLDSNAQISPSTSTSPILLFNPGQGTTDSDRVGDSIKITSIHARFQAEQNASATNTFMRVMLVIDQSPNGVQFAITDLLQSNSTDAFRNVDYGSRFIVLMDKRFTLQSNSNTTKVWQYNKDKCSYHMEFKGVVGTIVDITKCAINLVAISSEATNTPLLDYKTRIRYIDN